MNVTAKLKHRSLLRRANECLDAAREIACAQERSKFISLAASYMEQAAQIHGVNCNAFALVAPSVTGEDVSLPKLAEILNVSSETLRHWVSIGRLVPSRRTKGNHCRFDSDLVKMLHSRVEETRMTGRQRVMHYILRLRKSTRSKKAAIKT
jgi:hypothetical protein